MDHGCLETGATQLVGDAVGDTTGATEHDAAAVRTKHRGGRVEFGSRLTGRKV